MYTVFSFGFFFALQSVSLGEKAALHLDLISISMVQINLTWSEMSCIVNT